MLDQKSVFDLISDDFARLKSRNSSYSIRAYATKLGIDSGALTQILNGKRPITEKMAQRIFNGLGLSPDEQAIYFLEKDFSKTELELSADQHKLLVDWWHFAILALVETEDFESSTEFIAKRLSLPKRDIKNAIERLSRIGLLDTSAIPWRVAEPSVSTSDGIPSDSLKHAHRKNLDLAEASLYRNSVDERDFLAVTVATNPRQMKAAKKMIREFKDKLTKVLGKGPKTEVYKLCTQLIPLTQLGDTNE